MSKKHVFFLQKHVFSTKNGLINVGLMSIKKLNKERQPLTKIFASRACLKEEYKIEERPKYVYIWWILDC